MRFWPIKKPAPPVGLSARALRDEWLQWMLLGGSSEKTVYGYKRTTEKLLNRYPELAFHEFTEEHIQGIIEDAKPASRQTLRAPFTNWFSWGFRTRRIEKNPMHHVDTYKSTAPPAIDVFTEDECKILCALPEPDGTLIAFLLGTGLRKSEACNATVRRLDLDHAEYHVVEGAKGGKPRVVPLEAKLVRRMAALLILEGLGRDDYLWSMRPGGGRVRHDKPIHGSTFHDWWGKCVAKAGIPYRKPHTLRHSYATEWRRRGLVMDDVAVLLGHADIKTTKTVYDHTTVYDVRRRMEELK